MDYKFPKNFLFGVSMSGHQTEGNNINSDWWYYENHKSKTQKYPKEPSGIANDFWNRYKEDIDLTVELNCNSIRLGVEWSRIEPVRGLFDEEAIFKYKEILSYARSKKLKIFLTLHHFTVPLWFSEMGGFENSKAPEIFSNYSLKCVEEFKQYIDFFITINEPEILAFSGYLSKEWPPYQNNFLSAFIVLNNLHKSNNLAYSKIKNIYNVKVGIVTNIANYLPKGNSIFNYISSFLLLKVTTLISLSSVRNHIDFIGLNFYFTNVINGFSYSTNLEPKSDLNWYINFDSLRKVLNEIKKYKKDIYITENGIADSKDEKREWFIKNMLISCYLSIKEDNVPLRGYFHWTLCDNFEWHLGYAPQFGLVKIERDKSLKRIKRNSFNFYKIICKLKMISDN